MTACLSVALCSLPFVSHTGSGRALSVQSLWPQSWDNPQSHFSREAPCPGPRLGQGRERGEADAIPDSIGDSDPDSRTLGPGGCMTLSLCRVVRF